MAMWTNSNMVIENVNEVNTSSSVYSEEFEAIIGKVKSVHAH